MTEIVQWIGAGGDDPDGVGVFRNPLMPEMEGESRGELPASNAFVRELPAHNFPERNELEDARRRDERLDRNPDLWMYRGRAVGLLRRYLRFSLETGRLRATGGCEFFRAKITPYKAVTFEDRVIFVRDVEKCIARLEYWDQQLIECVILQEHNQAEAAHMLHCTRKTIQRRVPEVLDELSEDFLARNLLTQMPARRRRKL